MKEFSKRLNDLNTRLAAEFSLWANVQIGVTALAMIEKRVRRSGVAADGNKFSPYSSKPTLVGAKSFVTKAAAESVFASRKKRRALEWVTYKGHRLAVLPGGYKQIRRIEGRQVGYKGFERTSEMWKSMHVLGTKYNGSGIFVTTVGTENPLSIQKLEGNNAREGKEILALSDKEQKELDNILKEYIANQINKAFHG